MTVVLVVDTATPAITAGVVRVSGERVETLSERKTMGAKGHAEFLTPNIQAALGDGALSVSDLDAIVVGCGPGPFTGLRVGMATAAAMGLALDIPVYPVCTLDGIGWGTTGRLLVVTDARRREVYWAGYDDGRRVAGPAVGAPETVPARDYGHIAGSPDHTGLFELPLAETEFPSAERLVSAVRLGDPPEPLVPLYLRRPDAVEPKSRS